MRIGGVDVRPRRRGSGRRSASAASKWGRKSSTVSRVVCRGRAVRRSRRREAAHRSAATHRRAADRARHRAAEHSRLRPLHALRRLDLPLLPPRCRGEVDETLQLRRISLATFNARLPRRRTVFQVISISVVVVLVADRDPGALRLQTVGRQVRDPPPLAADAHLHRLHSAPRRRRSRPRRSRRKSSIASATGRSNALAQAGDYVPGTAQIDIYTRAVHASDRRVSVAAGAHRVPQRQHRLGRLAATGVADRQRRARAGAADVDPQRSAREPPSGHARSGAEDAAGRRRRHRGRALLASPRRRSDRIFRALFRNVRAGGVTEGGSTLTQQLVKNYYLTERADVQTQSRPKRSWR